MTTAQPTITETCSRCPNTLDTTGYPRWCKDCRAKYQKEYHRIKEAMAEGKGFAGGAAAMKDVLATEFDRLGSGTFPGYEIANLIRGCPIPTPS